MSQVIYINDILNRGDLAISELGNCRDVILQTLN